MPAGLQPAPVADRVTLIRRATFDLIGLPPKPEGVEAFVKDLQAADVPQHTRALADVCLALLNSNEFAYVY